MSSSPISHLSSLVQSSSSYGVQTTDVLLLRLGKLFSTPAGIDSTLLTIQYTLKFVGARLQARLESQLTVLANEVASKASGALLPGESVIAQIPAPSQTRQLAKLTESSKALSGKISDVRMFLRLWGLVGIYALVRNTYLNPPKDRVLYAITWAQATALTGFQFLENSVYLASLNILNSEGWLGEEGAKRKASWAVLSCRCWLAHIALDFARLGYVRYKSQQELKQPKVELLEGEKEEKLRAKNTEAASLWWRQLIKNAAYTPMALHYSGYASVSDSWVGATGFVAGYSGLSHLWKQTA